MSNDDDLVENPVQAFEDVLAQLNIHAERIHVVEERLRALLESTRLVTAQLDLPVVLREVVAAATRLVGVPYGALGVIGPDGSLVEFIHVGVSEQTASEIGHLPRGLGLLGAVVRGAHTIRLPDLSLDDRSVGFPAHHPPMRAFLGVPVRTRTEVYGNLYLTKPEAGTFSSEDERIIEALASTAGVAIENARLYERARRQRQLSLALSRVTTALLDPEEADALEIVAEQCAAVIPSVAVTIVVPDSDPDLMRVRVACGPLSASLRGITFPRSDSLAARAMALGEVVADDAPVREFADGELQLGPTAAVTLVANGETIGALCVSKETHRPPFTGEEIDIVGDFAAQAGLAISLAWAREDQERLHLIEDRARIARDLHDNVIQRLFATGLALEHAAETSTDQRAILHEHVENIDAAISDIRAAISAMGPPPHPVYEPLRDRIFRLANEMTPALRTRPLVHFEGPVDTYIVDRVLDDVIAVCREGLSNVARHARASRCDLTISADASMVRIVIEDDGDGLSGSAGHHGGIVNLRARARMRGGSSELSPNSRGGLTLRWQIPTPSIGASPPSTTSDRFGHGT